MFKGETIYLVIFFLLHCIFPLVKLAEGYPSQDDSIRKARQTGELAQDGLDSGVRRTRCSGCSNLKEGTDEYKLYIEKVKADILSKLNMKQAPKPRLSKRNIPSPIFTGELLGGGRKRFRGDEDDGYHGLTKQIIIVNDQGKNYCGPEKCVRFRFKEKLFGASELKSAQLWVYRSVAETISNTIQVFEVGREIDGVFVPRNKFLMASRLNSESTGWFVIDLSRFESKVRLRNFGSGTVDLILRVRCTGCQIANEGDRAPFLVMNANTNRVARKKRNLDCEEGKKGCCRERVYVNFTTIGWDDWIIQPKGYDANNCKGTCDHTSVPIYGHTSVMRRIGKPIKSCCVAKRLSPISMLYYDDAGYIFKKDIPNMSVEQCGCTS